MRDRVLAGQAHQHHQGHLVKMFSCPGAPSRALDPYAGQRRQDAHGHDQMITIGRLQLS